MATTIKGLKTALKIIVLKTEVKKANKRITKLKSRYRKFLSKLYLPTYSNCRESDASKDYANVYLTCLTANGAFLEYATDLSRTFYRKRNGKFYEKPTDYLDLRKLEQAIDTTTEKLGRIINELKSLGYDVYHDSELWE